MNDRDCDNCAHHSEGGCSVWECSFAPKEDDTISRQAAIDALICKMRPHNNGDGTMTICAMSEGLVRETLNDLPSVEPDIAEKLYLCKCYVTDEEGLQHEVIHTGDIRRITGWEI